MTPARRVLRWLGDNPILSRESRSRTRSGATTLALSASMVALGGLALILFSLAVVGSPSHEPGAGQLRRVAYHVAALQVVLVAIAAAVLGARAMSVERERSTLDLLLVGELSPMTVLASKLVGAVGYMILFVAAAVPIMTAVFLNAGLSVRQLIVTELLTVATALATASMGLLFGAMLPRASTATVAACGLTVALLVDIVIGGLVPAPASGLAQSRRQLLAGASIEDPTDLDLDATGRVVPRAPEVVHPARLANPLYGLHMAVNEGQAPGVPVGRIIGTLLPGSETASRWGPGIKPWQASVFASAILSLFCLSGANRFMRGSRLELPAKRRPLPAGPAPDFDDNSKEAAPSRKAAT